MNDYWIISSLIDDLSRILQANLNTISKNAKDVLKRSIIWLEINGQLRDAVYELQTIFKPSGNGHSRKWPTKFEYGFAFARMYATGICLYITLRAPLNYSIFADILNELQALCCKKAIKESYLLKEQSC